MESRDKQEEGAHGGARKRERLNQGRTIGFKLAKDKGACILRAKQMFPFIADELKLVEDHNKAEALLLAAWGQSQ